MGMDTFGGVPPIELHCISQCIAFPMHCNALEPMHLSAVQKWENIYIHTIQRQTHVDLTNDVIVGVTVCTTGQIQSIVYPSAMQPIPKLL